MVNIRVSIYNRQLFNCLPASIRNMTKCPLKDFKSKLDKFLEKVPDEPSVSGLTPAACTAEAVASNSILDQVRRVPGLRKRGPGA